MLENDLENIGDDIKRSFDKLQGINDEITLVSNNLENNQEILRELVKLRVESANIKREYKKSVDDIKNKVKLISEIVLKIEGKLGDFNYTGQYIRKQLDDVGRERNERHIDSRMLTKEGAGTYLNFTTTEGVSSWITTTFTPLLN